MINRIVLMGRLTADPDYRQTPNGIAVASFTVAVDRSYASKGQERQTDFIPCVAWRQTADFVSRYFQKGNMIAVDGSLQTRKYTDKQGNPRTAFEVIIDQVSFTGSKAESGGSSMPRMTPPQNTAPAAASSRGFNEPPQGGKAFEIGDFGDFEELDNDDGLPF